MDARTARVATVRVIAILAVALCLTACARSADDARGVVAAPEAREYRVPAGGQIVMSVSSDLALVDPAGLPQAPAPFAAKVAAAALQGLGDGSALVAINRKGLRKLSVSKTGGSDGNAFLVRVEPVLGSEAEFEHRTLGAAFSRGGVPVFFLYRHPDDNSTGLPEARHAFVAVNGLSASIWNKLPSIDAGAYLFSAFPMSADYLYIQMRKDTEKGFDSLYAAWNPDSAVVEAMTRTEFERRVRPNSPAAGGPALEACMASIAGPLVASASMKDGTRMAFLRGDIDQAVQCYAYEDASWTVVLASDGRLALLGPAGGTVQTMLIERPVERAVFRDVAMAGSLVLAVWEEDLFPNSGRSGIVIVDPAR